MSVSNLETVSSLKKERLKLWSAIVSVILTVVAATFFLTQPAARSMSMTPLSGLVGLKTMAVEAVPYQQAIASQNPTLIEFYANWCTTCQSMSTTIKDLHHQYGEKINFVMLDIDDPQWASQVDRYNATGVPQFTLLNQSQQSVETCVGKVPKPILSQTFDRLLAGHG
ncbi:MAG: thioredoxin domain-containing protein [Phormidesmis sp.]